MKTLKRNTFLVGNDDYLLVETGDIDGGSSDEGRRKEEVGAKNCLESE